MSDCEVLGEQTWTETKVNSAALFYRQNFGLVANFAVQSFQMHTYFDTLSRPLLSRVVLWLSGSPNKAEWITYTRGEDAYKCSILSTNLRSSLQQVCKPDIHNDTPWFEEGSSMGMHAVRHFLRKCTSDAEMFGTWASLSRLQVEFTPNSDAWYISRKDGNFTTLVLLKHMKQWQTEVDQLNEILTRCTSLICLYISKHVPNTSAAWMAIGPTLQYLNIYCTTRRSVIMLIKEHCRSLSELQLYEPECQEAYVQTITSYGNQILIARIISPTVSQCLDLLWYCPNLQLFLEINQNWSTNASSIIGKRAISILFNALPDLESGWAVDHLSYVSSECPNVDNILIVDTNLDISWHRAIESKASLEVLNVQVIIEEANLFFDRIANCTSSLKSITILEGLYAPNLSVWLAFVRANPLLEWIEIKFVNLNWGEGRGDIIELESFENPYFVQYLAALIESVKRHKHLISLDLKVDETLLPTPRLKVLEDACVPFRHRPVHILIGDKIYNPVQPDTLK